MPQISITRATESRINSVNIEQLSADDFGKHYTDHLFQADFIDGTWTNCSVQPFSNLAVSPFLAAFHYGQTIFEGMKAYRFQNENIATFRPLDHAKRFNLSAERLSMPVFPENLFLDGLNQFLTIDNKWVPKSDGSSLYIRPFMFSTDACLIARPSLSYKMMIVACPVGAYYSKPLKVMVEENYTRAAIGGTGSSKAGGNYAASFLATNEAMKKGFDQIIWTDANEHGYIQEMGASNIMFLIDNILYTPDLEDKTILSGITRKTIIELLQSQRKKVIEKKIHINEIVSAAQTGKLQEAFAVGTAATTTPIASITYKNQEIIPSDSKNTFSETIKQTLNDIRYGKTKDTFSWMKEINTL